MKKLILSSAVFALTFVVSTGDASAWSFKISRNGTDSYNRISTRVSSRYSQSQYNNVFNKNVVDVETDTGDNEVKDNTGGSNTLTTGEVTTDVTVVNAGGTNTDTDTNDCGCDEPDLDVVIKKNGSDSVNKFDYSRYSSYRESQTNVLTNINHIKVDSDTGDNKVKGNTGTENDGDVSVTSGNVTTSIYVENIGADNLD